jgi:serine/threonine protein kinase
MSPEVWRNVPYDEKSDMWALGVVLYEMAALQHPFEARSERCLSHKVIQGDFDPLPSGFSADITSMVRLLLNKVWPPRLLRMRSPRPTPCKWTRSVHSH